MLSTSHSLLDEIRSTSDGDCWARFVHLYTPVLGAWLTDWGWKQQTPRTWCRTCSRCWFAKSRCISALSKGGFAIGCEPC